MTRTRRRLPVLKHYPEFRPKRMRKLLKTYVIMAGTDLVGIFSKTSLELQKLARFSEK